jgi:hypothetical protein
MSTSGKKWAEPGLLRGRSGRSQVYFGEEVGGVRGGFKQKMAADKDTNENTQNKMSDNI